MNSKMVTIFIPEMRPLPQTENSSRLKNAHRNTDLWVCNKHPNSYQWETTDYLETDYFM